MHLKRLFPATAALAVLVLALGCAGGSSGGDAPASPATGSVTMSVSDASTEDWAVIGVKVLGITLTPTSGGTPRTVLITPATAPMLNLVQLDNLSDLLGTAQVPADTYHKATLTIAANPGDVVLTAANSPSASFVGKAGETIPPADIQIKGAQGATGSLTTTVTLTLGKDLVVDPAKPANLDLEFVLSHPAFIVDHVPAGGGATKWTVNFNDTLRHKPVTTPAQLVLRHLYGTVTLEAGGSLTLTREFPTLPIVTPKETATPTPQVLQLGTEPDGSTLFYDMDGQQPIIPTTGTSFPASFLGRHIRAAARYQPDGTLVVVRMWASADFNNVWVSPEGHVARVTIGTGQSSYQIAVEAENGTPVPVVIDNETQFYFHGTALTPVGTAFLDNADLVRGFKVHVSPVDPAASPLVAESVDIETARFSGYLSAASTSGFTYTHPFAYVPDTYVRPLSYIPAGTANGDDTTGTPVLGFQWWYLTEPGQARTDSGAASIAASTAVNSFAATVTGNVDFGGTVGPIKVWGASAAMPADAALSAWDARWTILEPIRLPKGTVVGSFAADAFAMSVKDGTKTPVVNLSSATGTATLVYQIDLSAGIYTLSPIDITTQAGQNALAANLTAGAPVQVYGVPQAGGTIMAYVLYYTTTNAL